jgi:hypothetical protein
VWYQPETTTGGETRIVSAPRKAGTGFNVSGGLHADLNMYEGQVTCGSGADATAARCLASSANKLLVTIENGFDCTNCFCINGVVDNQTDMTTIQVNGGQWKHRGATGNNITTLNLNG